MITKLSHEASSIHPELLKLENLKQTARALLAVVGTRDFYLRMHSEHVALLAAKIAIELELPTKDKDNLWLAGILHDVGKVGIPAEILHKAWTLSEHEAGLIESHVQISLSVLDEGGFPIDIVTMVGQHHERLNGTGYPHNLKGDEIVLGARILAVADVFDAMTSIRSYRHGFSAKEASCYLEQNKRILFEGGAVDALMRILPKMRLLAIP